MTDEPQKQPHNAIPYAALGWAFSVAVTVTALVTGIIAILEYAQQKSVTLEAEFFPTKIAFGTTVTIDKLDRANQYLGILQSELKASNRFDAITVEGKNSKLTLDDLAEKLTTESIKRAGPLAQLDYPPDGQMRIVVTNAGKLPATKVRVRVPEADLYIAKRQSGFEVVPHTEDGIELGNMNQGSSMEVFAFSRDGYRYTENYCSYSCDLVVAHEQGLGTVLVRVPRALFESVMEQGVVTVLLIYLIGVVGLIATIALLANAIQQIYRSVSGQQGASTASAEPK